MTGPAGDVNHLERLLQEADVSGWTVAYDHKDGDDSSWDEVWIRGHYGETIAVCGERYTMAPQHANLLATAVTQLPALLAALRDRDDLIRRQDAALTAVRELHVNDMSGAAAPTLPGMCEVCMWSWPCPTIRTLDTHAKDAHDA